MTREPLEARLFKRVGELGIQCLADKAMLENIAVSLASDLYGVNTGIHTVGEMLEIADLTDEQIMEQYGPNLYNGVKILWLTWHNFYHKCRYMAKLFDRFRHLLPEPPEDVQHMMSINESDAYVVGINTNCDCEKCKKKRGEEVSPKVHKGHALQNAPSTSARQ